MFGAVSAPVRFIQSALALQGESAANIISARDMHLTRQPIVKSSSATLRIIQLSASVDHQSEANDQPFDFMGEVASPRSSGVFILVP